MPLPHKTSKSTKPRKDIISPEVWRLINHLAETGKLKEFLHKSHDFEDVGIGSTQPDNGSVAVIAGSKNSGDRVVAHELVHLLSGKESRVDRMSKKIAGSSHPSYVGNIAYPKHWTEGKIGDRNTGAQPRSAKISRFIDEAGKRRFNAVHSSIPEGESWSGLEKNKKVYWDGHEEGAAYYMSSPNIKAPLQQERAKEFGMYLLQHDVPMDIVEPVVKRVGQLAKPKKQYSGGGANLARLRDSRSKRQ